MIIIKKVRAIQGLRGIATIMVFLSHFIGLLPFTISISNINLDKSPLKLIWGGNSAIIIFFLLSGYFMYASLEKKGTIKFIFQRFIRLYPAYAISVIVGFILCNKVIDFDCNMFSNWFCQFWQNNLDIGELLKHLSVFYKVNSRLINPPIWTLIIEMKMTIIIAVLIPILKKFNWKITYFIFIILSIIFKPIQYINVFVLGILINKNKQNILGMIGKFSTLLRVLIAFIGIFLLGFNYNMQNFYSKLPISIGTTILSLGSAIILIIILYEESICKSIPILDSKFMVVIGELSYYIYLTHFLVLLSLRFVMSFVNSYLVFFVLSFSVTIVFSYILKYFSEKISKKLSINFKKISDSMVNKIQLKERLKGEK